MRKQPGGENMVAITRILHRTKMDGFEIEVCPSGRHYCTGTEAADPLGFLGALRCFQPDMHANSAAVVQPASSEAGPFVTSSISDLHPPLAQQPCKHKIVHSAMPVYESYGPIVSLAFAGVAADAYACIRDTEPASRSH